MFNFKIFIPILFATVCIASTHTSVLANSYEDNDSQTTGNPIFELLNFPEFFCSSGDCDVIDNDVELSETSLEPKCKGLLREGTQCWKELANRPDCFVWDARLNRAQTVRWSGTCKNNLATGDGKLLWKDNKFSFEQRGTIINGKINGYASYRDSDRTAAEGSYADGTRQGHWILYYADGTVAEGPYVDGLQHGHWTYNLADGSVVEGAYFNGTLLGRETQYTNVTGEEKFLDGNKHSNYWTIEIRNGEVKWKNAHSFNDLK